MRLYGVSQYLKWLSKLDSVWMRLYECQTVWCDSLFRESQGRFNLAFSSTHLWVKLYMPSIVRGMSDSTAWQDMSDCMVSQRDSLPGRRPRYVRQYSVTGYVRLYGVTALYCVAAWQGVSDCMVWQRDRVCQTVWWWWWWYVRLYGVTRYVRPPNNAKWLPPRPYYQLIPPRRHITTETAQLHLRWWSLSQCRTLEARFQERLL